MSTRRQASTTSLSQFAHMDAAVDHQASLDFCNSFWGFGDQGFDVLSRRMKGAVHTTEELRNFWKERAAIEEDYAKRLSKLSKFALGKDEVGHLRRSFDTVKDETEKQAGYHMTLAQQIRTELEMTSAEFQTKQLSHKKIYLTMVEKQVKAKQLQESHVDKAREKYEQDCVKINSYTAQSSLVQGRDLEKIQLKLERAKQTVQANEREFANFTRAFESTAHKWEQDWKAFCDGCQDLEEARIDFVKENMWSYANFVSTVCVADDESCERVRQSLELIETDREIENFVNIYGTGSQIPDPPAFVNYQLPDATPSSSSKPTFRQANFTRTSARDVGIQLHRNSTYTPPTEDPPVNTAGRGAANARKSDVGPSSDPLARQPTLRNSVYGAQHPQPYTNGNNAGHSPSSSQNYQNFNQVNGGASATAASSSSAPIQHRQTKAASTPASFQTQTRSSSYHAVPPANDPHADPVDPTAETYIKVGSNAYKVDPSKDPQMNSGFGGFSSNGGSGSASRTNGGVSPAKQNGVDPLQKQLEELQSVMSVSGNGRRNTVYRGQANQASNAGPSSAGPGHVKSADSLQAPASRSPPTTSPSPGGSGTRDYRNSAELVVGAPPSAPPQSTSPNPPTATFMIPKHSTVPGTEVVTEVLADYHQSLPGERKSASGSTSRRQSFGNMQGPLNVANAPSGHGGSSSRYSLSVSPQSGPALGRPGSGGQAGIGAHGGQSRSTSPQPQSRGPSPGPGEVVHVGGFNGQPQQQNSRRNSFIMPPSSNGPARSTSPNPIGIALDPSGRVSHDEMAQRYQMQQQQQQQQQQQHQQHQHQNGQATPGHQPQTHSNIQPPPQHPQQQSRRLSYNSNAPSASTSMGPPPQAMYKPVTPPPPPPHILNVYHPPQHQQQQPPPQGYAQPGPGMQGSYAQYAQQQPQTSYQPPQQPQQPYAMVNAAINGQGQHRGISQNGAYGGPPNNNQNHRMSLTVGGNGGYRASSPGAVGAMGVGPSTSPQPIQQAPPPQMQVPHPQMQHQLPMGHQQMVAPQQGQAPGMYPQSSTAEDGQPILFYVKALYDYQATIDEEFDFQAGDIIGVTATPEDGWWSGELLDEARRQRGRYVFPSNFVCLF